MKQFIERPDGFSTEFYKTFWHFIDKYMMTMFVQLQQGTLPPYKLNFGVITLSPKKEDEVQIQQYRTISLFNGASTFFCRSWNELYQGDRSQSN